MTAAALNAWDVLLDIASDGGFEAALSVSATGHAFLSFEIHQKATPTGLRAAQIVTRLFNRVPDVADAVFHHCFELGAVYVEQRGNWVQFRGSLAGLAGTLQCDQTEH